MSQQIIIDSLKFAREGMSLQGELAIASMERVLDKLTDSSGFLSYHLQCQMSGKNRPQLVLSLKGNLSVCCQRCLEGISFPVDVHNILELIDDETDLSQDEIEDDSKDFLPMQKELDVAWLIEDEILLSLPLAPRHESCALPTEGQDKEKTSPFAVLADLKSKAK